MNVLRSKLLKQRTEAMPRGDSPSRGIICHGISYGTQKHHKTLVNVLRSKHLKQRTEAMPRDDSPSRGIIESREFPRIPANSRELPRCPAKSREVPRSLAKSREVPRSPAKSRKVSCPLRGENAVFLSLRIFPSTHTAPACGRGRVSDFFVVRISSGASR